jgi:hypothetical protein
MPIRRLGRNVSPGWLGSPESVNQHPTNFPAEGSGLVGFFTV